MNLREISIASIISRFYPESDKFAGLFACKFIKNAPTWLSRDEVVRNIVMLEVRYGYYRAPAEVDRVYLALIALTVLHSSRIIHGDPVAANIVTVSESTTRKDVLTWKSYESVFFGVEKEEWYTYSVIQNYRQSFVDIEVEMLERYVPNEPTFGAACIKDLTTMLGSIKAPTKMLKFVEKIDPASSILPTLQVLEHFYPRVDLD